MEKKIKYAWIDAEKNKLEVGYSYKEEGGNTVEVEGERHDDFLHPDLIAAFGSLRIHAACTSGFINPNDIENIKTPSQEFIDMFRVNQFSIGKDEDDPSVKITAGIYVPWMNNGYVAFNTPNIRYEQPEGYKHMKDLKKRIERCCKEILSYLDGSKRGEDPQGSLFEGQENGEQQQERA